MISKYYRLELPVFDPSEQLMVGTKDLRHIDQLYGEQETFLRFVHTVGPGEHTLKERLDKVATEFEHLEELTGGVKTINHQYGLYPVEDPRYWHLQQPHIVPEGFVLAAEVEIFPNISRFKPRPLNILRGIHRYRNQNGAHDDIRAGQYREGGTDSKEWRLIDIEPRLKPVSPWKQQRY